MLKRPRLRMPGDVKEALVGSDLMKDYLGRPAYQQNDYISWITRAKREDTRERRLAQMMDELETGDRYMNMSYRGRKGKK